MVGGGSSEPTRGCAADAGWLAVGAAAVRGSARGVATHYKSTQSDQKKVVAQPTWKA